MMGSPEYAGVTGCWLVANDGPVFGDRFGAYPNCGRWTEEFVIDICDIEPAKSSNSSRARVGVLGIPRRPGDEISISGLCSTRDSEMP